MMSRSMGHLNMRLHNGLGAPLSLGFFQALSAGYAWAGIAYLVQEQHKGAIKYWTESHQQAAMQRACKN
jgi:hypothetical protein